RRARPASAVTTVSPPLPTQRRTRAQAAKPAPPAMVQAKAWTWRWFTHWLPRAQASPVSSQTETGALLERFRFRARRGALEIEASAEFGGGLDPIGTVDQSLTPGGEVRGIEVCGDVQAAQAVAVS